MGANAKICILTININHIQNFLCNLLSYKEVALSFSACKYHRVILFFCKSLRKRVEKDSICQKTSFRCRLSLKPPGIANAIKGNF